MLVNNNTAECGLWNMMFLKKKETITKLSTFKYVLSTMGEICASLNNRKKTKADGSRLIPRKHTETLVLLSEIIHDGAIGIKETF